MRDRINRKYEVSTQNKNVGECKNQKCVHCQECHDSDRGKDGLEPWRYPLKNAKASRLPGRMHDGHCASTIYLRHPTHGRTRLSFERICHCVQSAVFARHVRQTYGSTSPNGVPKFCSAAADLMHVHVGAPSPQDGYAPSGGGSVTRGTPRECINR